MEKSTSAFWAGFALGVVSAWAFFAAIGLLFL